MIDLFDKQDRKNRKNDPRQREDRRLTTFAEFSAEHRLTASELSELGYALAIVRGGCGTVKGKKFINRELLDTLREEAYRQERAGAKLLADVLDIAHCELLAKFIADHEREQFRRGRAR